LTPPERPEHIIPDRLLYELEAARTRPLALKAKALAT